MIQNRTSAVLAGILISALLFACSGGPKEIYEVDGVYSFTLQGLNGEQMDFADLRGKVVMFNAWATWCAPCMNEIPMFVDLYEKYRDKGLEIWGVSTDIQGKSIVVPKVEELGINYPVLLARDSHLLEIFGVSFRGLPVTLFFDREGKMADTTPNPLVGPGDLWADADNGETLEMWFEKKILALLDEK